jgi:hypothetical protein
MTEADESDWDRITDVICAGAGPGLFAFATLCAADGLDVIVVSLPSGPLDIASAAFLSAMTEDLEEIEDAAPQRDAEPIRAVPEEFQRGRGERIDTFEGAQLRPWASRCRASASGVLFTEVPDHLLRPMRTDGGELITAALLPETGPPVGDSGQTLSELVLVAGRPAGAVLDGPDGRLLVAAERGIVFGLGRTGAPCRTDVGTPLAMVSRRGSLFGCLQPLCLQSVVSDE